ncbi:MAG: cell division protein FtsL [Hyphomonadaceae bacterium]
MMKQLAIVGVLVAGGLAIGVYRAKLGAQETEARIEKIEGEIAKAKDDLQTLRAEEAYLSRPERLGPIAHDKLGLVPETPDQYSAPEQLAGRLGEGRSYAPAASSEGGGAR